MANSTHRLNNEKAQARITELVKIVVRTVVGLLLIIVIWWVVSAL